MGGEASEATTCPTLKTEPAAVRVPTGVPSLAGDLLKYLISFTSEGIWSWAFLCWKIFTDSFLCLLIRAIKTL